MPFLFMTSFSLVFWSFTDLSQGKFLKKPPWCWGLLSFINSSKFSAMLSLNSASASLSVLVPSGTPIGLKLDPLRWLFGLESSILYFYPCLSGMHIFKVVFTVNTSNVVVLHFVLYSSTTQYLWDWRHGLLFFLALHSWHLVSLCFVLVDCAVVLGNLWVFLEAWDDDFTPVGICVCICHLPCILLTQA